METENKLRVYYCYRVNLSRRLSRDQYYDTFPRNRRNTRLIDICNIIVLNFFETKLNFPHLLTASLLDDYFVNEICIN